MKTLIPLLLLAVFFPIDAYSGDFDISPIKITNQMWNFNFSSLEKKVQVESPDRAPSADYPTPKLYLQREFNMGINTSYYLPTKAEKQEDYAKTVVEYDDYKNLVKTLPAGVKDSEILSDLVAVRESGDADCLDTLKYNIRQFIHHTGKFISKEGRLQSDKILLTFENLDIGRSPKLSMAIQDLQEEIFSIGDAAQALQDAKDRDVAEFPSMVDNKPSTQGEGPVPGAFLEKLPE